jgi:hypothetical protein
MSYKKDLAKKQYMDNIVNKSNKDLQVYVQKEFNLNAQESSVNKKRALEDTEDSHLQKK